MAFQQRTPVTLKHQPQLLSMRKLMLLLSLLAALSGCQYSQLPQPDKRILSIPSLNLLLTDSTHIINTQQTPPGKPTLVLYYSAGCAACREQTQELLNHYTQLKNYRLYFCSSDPLTTIRDFTNSYQLNRYSNITVGRDYEHFFDKQLNINSYPSLFIYTSENRLQKIAMGFIDAETIIHFINS